MTISSSTTTANGVASGSAVEHPQSRRKKRRVGEFPPVLDDDDEVPPVEEAADDDAFDPDEDEARDALDEELPDDEPVPPSFVATPPSPGEPASVIPESGTPPS